MTQYLRAFAAEGASEDPNAPIRFIASTEGVKADGQDLRMEDWALDRYIKHPVVLYAHDYMGNNLPIGTGQPSFDERDLIIDVTYDTADEFAMRVRAKALKRMIAGSVGWDTLLREGKRINELLEFSMVPVPMDPDALPTRQRTAWADMGRELLSLAEDGDTWTDTAAAMVDLYLDRSRTSDAERRKDYNRTARLYRLAGKTAPEFLRFDALAALGVDEIAGLFLEGEAEMLPDKFVRVGKVLSARNLGDLEQAIALVNGVIERAKKEDPDMMEDEEEDDPMMPGKKKKKMGEPERTVEIDEATVRLLFPFITTT